jgi:predicted nucleotidyltransferase
LFGSYAKGEPGEASDVDLIVDLECPIGFDAIATTGGGTDAVAIL